MFEMRKTSVAHTNTELAFVALILCGALGLLVTRISVPNLGGYFVAICCLLGIFAILITAMIIVVRQSPQLGFRNPSLVLFGFLLVIYALRPVYILVTGESGSHQLDRFRLADVASEFTETLGVVLLAVFCFTVAFFIAPTNLLKGVFQSRRELNSSSWIRLGILGLLGTFAAFTIFRDLSAASQGWQAALTVRGSFFEGRNYLVLTMNLYRAALLTWLAFSIIPGHQMPRRKVFFVLILWMGSILFDLLSGGRAELILRNFLPFAIIVSFSPTVRRSSKTFAIGALILMVVLFVGYRTVVRDSVTSAEPSQDSAVSMVVGNILNLPEYVLGGDESAAFDSLMITRKEIPGTIGFRGGEQSWKMILMAPFPSVIAPDKPERTTTQLTRALRRDLFERNGNIAFSGAADFYYSFGNTLGSFAVVIGFAILGFASGAVIRSAVAAAESAANPCWPLVFGFVTAASVFSVFRADLFELPLSIIRVGMLLFCFWFLTRPARPHELNTR
jgi:hypothetical protein